VRPRQYAQQIIKLTSREERRAALEKVPAHLRDMVKTHVEVAYEQLRRIRKHGR